MATAESSVGVIKRLVRWSEALVVGLSAAVSLFSLLWVLVLGVQYSFTVIQARSPFPPPESVWVLGPVMGVAVALGLFAAVTVGFPRAWGPRIFVVAAVVVGLFCMSWFFLDDERDEARFVHCATLDTGRFQTDQACRHAGLTRVRYVDEKFDDQYFMNTVPLPHRMTSDREALLAAGARACDWLSAQPWGPAPPLPPPYSDRPDGVVGPRFVDYKLDLQDPTIDPAEQLSLQVADTAWHYLCLPELNVHRANSG